MSSRRGGVDMWGEAGWTARDLLPSQRIAEPTPAPSGRALRRARTLLSSMVVLGLLGTIAGYGSYSAFTATTTNTGNSFASGTVAIGDNDAAGAMLSLANAKPGDSDTSCIRVTYTGTLGATVRLYGTTTGTLPQYLTLTITRGTDSSPSFDSCAGFTADATNYTGAGSGVVYSGNLSALGSTYAAGVVDPTSASPESWTENEAHSYKFTVTVQDTNAAQGVTGTAAFTWEARNQ